MYALKVRVYFNLHKRRFSVLVKQANGWRLSQHTDHIVLRDAVFKVNEAGRQRVLRQRRKNVHAFVEGTVGVVGSDIATLEEVSYSPYKNATFMRAGLPIHSTSAVALTVGSTRKPAIFAA